MTDRAGRRAWIRRLLGERERQGLTLAELSRRSGVPVGTLASWMARLRREAQAGCAEDRRAGSTGFVELVSGAAELHPPSLRFEVVLRGERRIVVPPAFDPSALERLVRALEAC
jgi:transcriptional regulator with XRE-family HTH domain